MKPTITPFRLAKTAVAGFALLLFLSTSSFAVNIIAGIIFDKTGNPLTDIDVELLDEYQRQVPGQRTKTQSTGRFEFQVNNSGRYYIRVYAFQYDLMDETREVNVANVSAGSTNGGSSYNTEDFYLQPRKGGLKEAELAVVFAQDVPESARSAYRRGCELIDKKNKPAEGYAELQNALKLFPNYFEARYRYGTELFRKKQFEEAAAMFYVAATVNAKSAYSYYFLGYSFNMLGKDYKKAALVAANEALKLAPLSSSVLMLVGRIERSTGDFPSAEKHLLQAKKNSATSIPEIHKELSELYANDMKKYSDAADELESYIKSSKMTGDTESRTRKIVDGLREKAKAQTN